MLQLQGSTNIKFVLCLTNVFAVVTENINSKILKLEKNGKIAQPVDEIHQWTISSEDGQKSVVEMSHLTT